MQLQRRKGIFFMKDMNFARWERSDLKNSKEKQLPGKVWYRKGKMQWLIMRSHGMIIKVSKALLNI